MCQDIGIQYNSPTVGLYFFYPDYIRFLENIDKWIHIPLEFKEKSKYELGRIRYLQSKKKYLIGVLSDGIDEVEIEFLHYYDETEAREKWNRRCQRINVNKMLVIGSELDSCSQKDIECFSQLPYNNKIFFTAHNYKIENTIYMKEMEKQGFVNAPARLSLIYKYMLAHLERCPFV
jgi:uncharacterized protein (DUF1919 family)